MILATPGCTEILAAPGKVRLVGCALDTRLIEIFDAKYALPPASPNPFAGSVSITFSTGVPGYAQLSISDQAGRHVTTLVDGEVDAGEHVVVWDASDVPTGRYYITVVSGTWRQSGMVVKVE